MIDEDFYVRRGRSYQTFYEQSQGEVDIVDIGVIMCIVHTVQFTWVDPYDVK